MKNFKDGGFRKGGFNNKSKFGGGERRGGDSGGGGRDRGGHGGKPEMFSAICSTCGKNCQVPFRPSGDKPVYCSDCFGKRSDESDGSRGGRHDGNRRSDSRSDRPDYTKLPRDQRPARHDPSRGKQDNGHSHDEIVKKLATIESRLNRILDLINPPTPPTKVVEAEKVVEKVDSKTTAVVRAGKKTDKKVVKKAVAKKATKPKATKKPAPSVKTLVKDLAKKVVTKKAVKKAPAKKAVAKKTTKAPAKK